MTFKKKSIILFTFIFCLALLYAAAVIFNTNGAGPQNSEYSWMDRKYIDYADRIEIYGPSSNFILVKRNNIWLMQDSGSGNNVYYPVKQARPQDLLSDLCRPGVYPVRSYSSSVQDVYGLGENASHIIVRGGAGPPLLDLLI
ncbi:MAG: hypothetical protein FWD78_17235, partial [Treponema sp.]|nr:hypothetical protein [Treponema sp.]